MVHDCRSLLCTRVALPIAKNHTYGKQGREVELCHAGDADAEIPCQDDAADDVVHYGGGGVALERKLACDDAQLRLVACDRCRYDNALRAHTQHVNKWGVFYFFLGFETWFAPSSRQQALSVLAAILTRGAL